jgi:hypothetical protein
MIIKHLLNTYTVKYPFQHNPDGKTNEELRVLLEEGQFTKENNKIIIQSGEINAFTYNKEYYAIMQWLKEFKEGGKAYCSQVQVYAGPEIIYEKTQEGLRNDLIDKYIRPALDSGDSRFSLFYTPKRYHVHSYRVGRHLLVFGMHNFANTNSNYTDYVFDIEDAANHGLKEYHDDDLVNGEVFDMFPIEKISSSEEMLSKFTIEEYTRCQYDEIVRSVKESKTRGVDIINEIGREKFYEALHTN